LVTCLRVQAKPPDQTGTGVQGAGIAFSDGR
jgi:hypothetical protein